MKAQLTLAVAWLRKHAVVVGLILAAILVAAFGILLFWLKVRGHSIETLSSLLQVAAAKNEVSSLETKKAVLQAKAETKTEDIQQIDAQIKAEQRKAEKAKLEIKGLSNEDVAARLSELGF